MSDNELLDIVSLAIKEEIDWEILSNFLIEQGWFKISFGYRVPHTVKDEIIEWCKYTLKDKFRYSTYEFLFESEKDAAWFTLKWING